ncbi:MAG: 50S ribosomal protein L4 [Candidatus Omnitrophota bacterium]|nr:50S ribosomal protein L4 [Candidatus Omnitrophota bacterium]
MRADNRKIHTDMEAPILPIYNTEGKEIDKVKLSNVIFDGSVNTASIYMAVNAYRANQRKGLAATKTRGEVSGGGRKPWKQKGTGRARVGSTRSPLWRHGGVIFGPHPRDFYYKIPDKIKSLSLKASLNAKLKENNILVLDEITLKNQKTKEAGQIFSNLKISPARNNGARYALLLSDKIDSGLRKALRNLAFLDVNIAKDTHTYEIMSHKKIIITKAALAELTKRLKG